MSKSKKHILIAEDDAFLAKMMQRVVTGHGMDVTVVHDGREAIAAIKRNAPQMLLLDLLMPHVDGFGVLQHMKEEKLKFPVLVLSNLGDGENKKRCKDLGAVGYVVKSDIDDDQLWAVVKKYLP